MPSRSDPPTATTRASPDWPGLGTLQQRAYRLELGADELIVRELDGTEYGIPLGRISRLRIGVFAADGWRAALARASRLYPSLRLWIGDDPKGLRFYAYDEDPAFRTFMRAMAARVISDHRFTSVETGEHDLRTFADAALAVVFAAGVPVLVLQGVDTAAVGPFVYAALSGAVAVAMGVEAFRRWPRRASTMAVIDAALRTEPAKEAH